MIYMYGLADNDIVGAVTDAEVAPKRPIPSKTISLRSAKIARSTCLFGSLLVAALFNLPPAWWLMATLLTGTICLYNRIKNKWLMGLCRALSVVCGAAAVLPIKLSVSPALGAVAAMAIGWMLYIAAVTKISEDEDCESQGLGVSRYFLGLSALVPLVAGCFFNDPRMWLLPTLGCVWTFVSWCAIVRPLGEAHSSEVRRRAVGSTIGALLYLQIGFILILPNQTFIAVATALWLSARFIRRFAPSISGS